MKTVYPAPMVAHLWANQSQEHARNAGRSFWFNHSAIYSYHTPIAMLHTAKDGERIALVTSDGYSMTTKSKHLPNVRRALPDSVRTFRVPFVGATGGRAPRDPFTRHSLDPAGSSDSVNGWHAANLAYLLEEYKEHVAKLKRQQQSLWAESREALALALCRCADVPRGYALAFDLEFPRIDHVDDARVVWRTHEIRAERRADPNYDKARKAARAAREALKEKQRLERAAEYARLNAERIAAWRTGEQYGYTLRDERGGAMLRVDGDMVRTSLGAECPAADARTAFALIARCKERGVSWQASGLHGVKLGSFALSSVMPDGTIRAGCHTIYWSEIAACARALGLDVQE